MISLRLRNQTFRAISSRASLASAHTSYPCVSRKVLPSRKVRASRLQASRSIQVSCSSMPLVTVSTPSWFSTLLSEISRMASDARLYKSHAVPLQDRNHLLWSAVTLAMTRSCDSLSVTSLSADFHSLRQSTEPHHLHCPAFLEVASRSHRQPILTLVVVFFCALFSVSRALSLFDVVLLISHAVACINFSLDFQFHLQNSNIFGGPLQGSSRICINIAPSRE